LLIIVVKTVIIIAFTPLRRPLIKFVTAIFENVLYLFKLRYFNTPY